MYQHIKKSKKFLASFLSFVLVLSHFSMFLSVPVRAAHDDRGIYSLATDSAIQNLELGATGAGTAILAGTEWLNSAGGATFTIVEHPVSGNSIELTGRAASHYGVDIARGPLAMELGNLYTIRVEGRAEAGTQIIIGGPDSPWSWLANTNAGADGTFALTATVNHTHLEHSQFSRGFRIQGAAGLDFTIDEIVVMYVGPDHSFDPDGGDDDGDVDGIVKYDITFGDDWADLADYIGVGDEQIGTRVTDFGRTNDYSFRLENVTGQFISSGNALIFDPPTPLQAGGRYAISWWVYIPADENPNLQPAGSVGPGLVLNEFAGRPALQPTNDIPAPGDLGRRVPTGEWVQTTTFFNVGTDTGGNVNRLFFRFRVNDDRQQPAVYYIDDIVITQLSLDDDYDTPEWDLTLPSLHEAFADYFIFGNILEPGLINNNPNDVIDMFLHHYNSVTAENAMKPDNVSGGLTQATRPDTLNLDGPRTMVNFAEEHGLHMVGHTLIWHEQSSLWQYQDPDTGEFLTRAEAKDNMRWFIREYAGYFAGRIDAWDVTNEVFTNSGEANQTARGPVGSPVYATGTWQRSLRNYAPWYHAFANGADFDAGERGYDYIYYAFVFARTYAPCATLIYNDFNDEFPAKRHAMATMTEQLNERWANDSVNNPAYGDPTHPDYGRLLIEVIGMQAHYNQGTNLANVRASIERFIQTGARIHVTELDITIAPGAPFLTDAQLQHQADMFGQLFEWYVEFANYIDRVTIWGREDGSSWRGDRGPTLFDRNLQAKPAFWAVLEAANRIPDGPVEDAIVYSLATDEGIQALAQGTTGGSTIFNATPFLQGSGSPVVTIVPHPVNPDQNSLAITDRDADWHTFDLLVAPLGLDRTTTYTMTVVGRVPNAGAGTLAQVFRSASPWSSFADAQPDSDGNFVLEFQINAGLLAGLGDSNFRIRTNDSADFIIDEILVTYPRPIDVIVPGPGEGVLIPAEITLAANRVRGFEVDGFDVERSELSWELEGNLSAGTTIENGFLRIAEDNPRGTIIVRAYVTADPTIYGIAVVTVGGASDSLIHNLPAGLNFDQYPSLRAVYADYFLMGVAGDSGLIAGTGAMAQLRAALVGHHYNSWSFENSMKVSPLRGNNAANRLQPSAQWPGVNGPRNTMTAARNAYADMSFAGHTTAWHSQSPDWMWDRHTGGTANREIALENLRHHIRGTFTEFGSQISSMDVVNEALGSVSPTNPYDWRDALTRGEGWSPTLGYYWVKYAFIFAAEIVDELDLDVTLYYNDFLLHTTNKGIAAYTMVRDINNMHANGEAIHPITGEVFQRANGRLLIEGVGMQDRQSGIIDIDGFSTAINMFAELGVMVAITELDLSWRVTSPDGLLTAEEQIAQGQQMARFMEMIRRYAAGPATAGSPYPRVVERITFWGIDDTHSWAPGEPMLFGRPNTANGTIPGKEALRAVIDPFQFLEDHPWFLEELPPVPGVYIFDLQEDGFTGANIILGNDEAAWPYSTAGDAGEVAFTPQPGATYHLLVRYQTFGTYGLEAHWIRDNSQDNFTSASNAAAVTMGTVTRGSATTGPSATAIPTRFFNPGVGGSFAFLETTFTMPADGLPDGLLGNIALRGINGGHAFGIYSIQITRLNADGDDTLLVNYPFLMPLVRPEVPGIIVPEPNDAQNNGRADIIIGSGRDVWPFADAHESGVAFDPVPGTTYRIMFNITTTGANGWRVRWIPGTGGEDYTTGDGAIVNGYPLRVSSFGLGVPTPDLIPVMPVASQIPSHQNSGVSPAGVYTIIQDITLTGNETYQGLIGNIALRGTGGSGNFFVNWISIQELEAGPGTEAVETLNFWPFGVDAFEDFSMDPIGFVQGAEGFRADHFSPNVLNVANNSLSAITRQGATTVVNAANPPQVGDVLVAGRITGGNGTGSGLRSGTTQGFLAGTPQFEWLVGGEVVQSGPNPELTLLPAHVGQTVQVRLTSDWETGQLTSAATVAVVPGDDIDPTPTPCPYLLAAIEYLRNLVAEKYELDLVYSDFTVDSWADFADAKYDANAILARFDAETPTGLLAQIVGLFTRTADLTVDEVEEATETLKLAFAGLEKKTVQQPQPPRPPATIVNRGWVQTGGQWYRYDDNGQRETGWILVGSRWYFMNPAQGERGHTADLPFGAMRDGWVQTGARWYFLNPASGEDGHATNRPHGAMLDGWVFTDGQWYFLNPRVGRAGHNENLPHGAMAVGWLSRNGNYYFLNPRRGHRNNDASVPHGAMLTGRVRINGVLHRFRTSGRWVAE